MIKAGEIHTTMIMTEHIGSALEGKGKTLSIVIKIKDDGTPFAYYQISSCGKVVTETTSLSRCYERYNSLYLTAQDAWNALGEIPVDSHDDIEESFLQFPSGTDKFEVWHWIEEYYDISIAFDLLNLAKQD